MIGALYRSAVLLAAAVAYPLFKMSARGKVRLQERYGQWPFSPPTDRDVIWFHGASAGETRGLIELLPFFRIRNPNSFLLHTATSNYAESAAKDKFDATALLPFDARPFLKRSIGDSPLQALVIGETEIWPELLRFGIDRGAMIFFVNARISDATQLRYRLLSPLLRPLLKHVTHVAVADSRSRERFNSLGVPLDRITIAGNTKYDRPASVTSSADATKYAHSLFAEPKKIVTLGSIRPEEEKVWFPPLVERIKAGAPLQVVVAPRHREKFDYFAEALRKTGVPFTTWSAIRETGQPATVNAPFLLLDTFGELEKVYSCSQLAFIGASLVPIGGHNPLEAAAYSVPVVMGPNSFVVAEIVGDLKTADAIREVRDQTEVAAVLDELLDTREPLAAVGKRGFAVYSTHLGATQRVIAGLAPYFPINQLAENLAENIV